VPVRFAAKVAFTPGGPEYRFDFTFAAPSVDLAPASVAVARRPNASGARVPASSAAAPANSAAGQSADATLAPPAPVTIPEIVDAMRASRREIGARIEAGDLSAIWVPAFKARDLALTLEPHVGHLSDGARASAESAIFRLVQAAWRLDAVGDTGSRADVDAALLQFDGALQAVEMAFAP
jgi:hypothetical protein